MLVVKNFKNNRPTNKLNPKDYFQDIKDFLIETAGSALKQEQSRGFAETPKIRVDNRFGKRIVTVKPLGKIEFIEDQSDFEFMKDLITKARELAPVKTGRYRQSLAFYRMGREGGSDYTIREIAEALKKHETNKFEYAFQFLVGVPYASRLEYLGVTRRSRGKRTITGHKRSRGVFKRLLRYSLRQAHRFKVKLRFKHGHEVVQYLALGFDLRDTKGKGGKADIVNNLRELQSYRNLKKGNKK